MSKLTSAEKSIINSYPFAKILSSQVDDFGFSLLTDCPLMLLNNEKLLGHLSCHNPILTKTNNINNCKMVRVIYSGPHGYISPRWHSEQKVPTWNYASIALTCRLTVISNADTKLSMLRAFSDGFDPSWDFNEFDNKDNSLQVNAMLAAITVFELEIVAIDSKLKLSQNRSLACRKAFQDALTAHGNTELADIQLLE